MRDDTNSNLTPWDT